MREPELNPIEIRILELLANGKIVKEIATKLRLSPGTVRSALARIYQKFDVHSSTAAVAAYLRSNLRSARLSAEKTIRYRQALIRGDFDGAIALWDNTLVSARPVEARIYMCVVLLMRDRWADAMEEAKMLIGHEASLIYVFQQWLDGDENALLMLQRLVGSLQSGTHGRCAGLIALYLGGIKHNLMQIVRESSSEFFIELENQFRR